MTTTPQRFDPLLQHLLMLEQAPGQATAEIDLALIDQAAKANRHSLLMALEASLTGGDPGDLPFRDHTRMQGLKEELTKGHGCCNEVVTSWRLGRAGASGALVGGRPLMWMPPGDGAAGWGPSHATGTMKEISPLELIGRTVARVAAVSGVLALLIWVTWVMLDVKNLQSGFTLP